MSRKVPPLTEAEFSLMKVHCELGACTVADERAGYRDDAGGEAAYTTVMTLLGRMEKKGAVRVDKSREPYVYRPAFRKLAAQRDRLRAFIASVFDGKADELVLQLVEDDALSEEELKRIEEKLEGLK
jgi:predicted transcriptional regulator